MKNWIRLLRYPSPLPPLMVPVCLPYMAKCWVLYINVFPCAHLPQTEVIHASSPHMNLHNSCHWPRINRLRETLVFVFTTVMRKVLIGMFFLKKKKKMQTDREAKILSLHHQGGGVRILHFQVLIYWILEVGGSPTMKYHIWFTW